jgi:hypothetical protein
MKKLLFVVLIGLLVSTAAFADHEGFGIGLVFGGGWNNGGLGWGALSLKIPSVPIFWGLSIPFVGRSGGAIGVSGDYYIFDKSLVAKDMTNDDGTYKFKLDWYFGVGGYFNLYFHNDYWENGTLKNKKITKASDSFGLRVPVGLSWHIIKQLELFLGLVPGFGVWCQPIWDPKGGKYHEDTRSYEGAYDTDWGASPFIGGEIGLRVWF